MSHPPALIIHGHFYQPPRENPWTFEVEREPSAAPFHDWNERVFRECYRPNGWARIFDADGRIEAIVNNYEAISFNFGPTLLAWLERHHPPEYRRILSADRNSRSLHEGHGNAIAQGYNHAILPLCNDRDLRTQIRWGLAEFEHRFGRPSESLWLPETACDDRTLGALIEEGVRYVLLAPGQAEAIRGADGTWEDVSDGSIDPTLPYRYDHPDGSGRSIAIFFYDGAVARSIAFEGALTSSRVLLDRFERAGAAAGRVVHAATDGESYGHHFKFGDRCLAHALTVEAQKRGFWVTNYGELLDHHPPTIRVRIKKGDDGLGTAWSCAHGVGRWHRDCGCHTGGQAGWNQRWRKPLRAALDVLRDEAAAVFEDRGSSWRVDPWTLRDRYIRVVVDRRADPATFVREELGPGVEPQPVLRLLESQRDAMLMYTSCGWFFNDLSGIETLQILRYAGRLLDHLDAMGESREDRFLEVLAEAKSNLVEHGTGADLYRTEVVPRRVTEESLAAHISLRGLVETPPASGRLAGRHYQVLGFERRDHPRWRQASCRIELEDRALATTTSFAACSFHFGTIEMTALLEEGVDAATYEDKRQRIWSGFERGSLLYSLSRAQEV
ncbi:MAG: DUF3536 domain-containing protein [Myxococcota bacterium]